MSTFTKAQALKEIRTIATENGMTFKRSSSTKINDKPTYTFISKRTGNTLITPTLFWCAYANCMSGYVADVGAYDSAAN
jgi:uncharacterized protein YktB (UPF0637 family)